MFKELATALNGSGAPAPAPAPAPARAPRKKRSVKEAAAVVKEMTRVRLNNRLTQTQTAELIGISAPSLSKWEAPCTFEAAT